MEKSRTLFIFQFFSFSVIPDCWTTLGCLCCRSACCTAGGAEEVGDGGGAAPFQDIVGDDEFRSLRGAKLTTVAR